jgi:4-hydroxy-tetrahydrodipicolinate reductase
MIRVAILGASGRMGTLATQLVNEDANLKLHAALRSSSSPEEMLGADVVLDFTLPSVSESLVRYAIENDLKVVIGTSGWSENKLAGLEKLLLQHPNAAVVLIPNFSIGSMLGQLFAAQAAKFFSSIEIVESHHAAKADSPSGTAIRTAELISESRSGTPQPLIPGVEQEARGEVVAGVPVHSLRLEGIGAKQEVHFAGNSEVLKISHEVSSNQAYSHGILRSIEFAVSATGLTIGLDKVVLA